MRQSEIKTGRHRDDKVVKPREKTGGSWSWRHCGNSAAAERKKKDDDGEEEMMPARGTFSVI